MTIEIKVPSIGESISEATISSWIKKTGETVQQDAPICEIESDKATVELVAEADGILTVLVEEGETVAIGAKIATIDPQKPQKKQQKKQQEKQAPPSSPPQPPSPNHHRVRPIMRQDTPHPLLKKC